jgi:hypothetical protein
MRIDKMETAKARLGAGSPLAEQKPEVPKPLCNIGHLMLGFGIDERQSPL